MKPCDIQLVVLEAVRRAKKEKKKKTFKHLFSIYLLKTFQGVILGQLIGNNKRRNAYNTNEIQ